MTKDEFLTVYIDIENNYYIRAEKIERINRLLSQLKADKTIFLLEEVIIISNQLLLAETTIRQPVFAAVIHPILSQGVEAGNTEAIKSLIKLAQPLHHYQSYTKHYQYSTRAW